jgi:hypothetical protein
MRIGDVEGKLEWASELVEGRAKGQEEVERRDYLHPQLEPELDPS